MTKCSQKGERPTRCSVIGPRCPAQEVLRFVADRCGVRKDKLTLDTTLFGDLGMDGDDADEFFEDFSKRFKVDLRGLDLPKHFGSEAGASLTGLAMAVL